MYLLLVGCPISCSTVWRNKEDLTEVLSPACVLWWREWYSLEVKGLLDFLYLGKPCPKSKFLFPSLASSWSMASGRSLGWLIVSVCSRNARAERIQKIIYIFSITSSWHHVNPKSTPISYSVSNVTLAPEWPQTGGKSQGAIVPKLFFRFSGRLSGQFEAIWGEGCKNFLPDHKPRNLNIYP